MAARVQMLSRLALCLPALEAPVRCCCLVQEFQLPEIKRSPLDEMCLQVRIAEAGHSSGRRQGGLFWRCGLGNNLPIAILLHALTAPIISVCQPFDAAQVKLLEGPGQRISIGEFLGKAVEPPLAVAVDSAVRLLEDIGKPSPSFLPPHACSLCLSFPSWGSCWRRRDGLARHILGPVASDR